MLYFDVPHNSDEWFECRRGMPTSSCFDKIVTPSGVFSKQSESFAMVLLAELITGEPQQQFAPTYWMERGSILEQEAADQYEFMTGHTLLPGGFITDDQMRWGASPDRMVANKNGEIIGALEIKCPAPWTHVKNRLDGKIDQKYYPQVQGQMLVCENLKFVDWFSYHPQMVPSLITTPRDDKYIDTLHQGLLKFHEKMDEYLDRLVELGDISEKPNKLAQIKEKAVQYNESTSRS